MARRPGGPEQVNHLDGSDDAKHKTRIILETLVGHRTVEDACQALDIGPTRFDELRRECLQGAVTAMEPKPIGRPQKPQPVVDERLTRLEDENRRLRVELVTSHVREELAIGLPHVARSKKNKTP